MVKLDRCNGSSNTLDDPSCIICLANKTKGIDLNVFNMIRINESKTLIKHISCKCKCKFDGRKYNSNQRWNDNNNKSKKTSRVQKGYIWNPST